MEGDLPLDVIVTKVSQDECLDYFCEESSPKPEVATISQIKILSTGLVNLLVFICSHHQGTKERLFSRSEATTKHNDIGG